MSWELPHGEGMRAQLSAWLPDFHALGPRSTGFVLRAVLLKCGSHGLIVRLSGWGARDSDAAVVGVLLRGGRGLRGLSGAYPGDRSASHERRGGASEPADVGDDSLSSFERRSPGRRRPSLKLVGI